MNAVVSIITNDDFTIRVGRTYVLVLDRAEHRTILRYDPGSDEEDPSLTLYNEARLMNLDGTVAAVCHVEAIDRGLLGDVGPRDGITRCKGQLGVAAGLLPDRSRLYRMALDNLMLSGLSLFLMFGAPEVPQGETEPVDQRDDRI
jgi:hypothetical protein